MTDSNELYDYHSQCLTCNLSTDLIHDIHEATREGVGYTDLSRRLASTHNITISPDALSNHLRFHARANEKTITTEPTESTGPQTLLGVASPPKPPKGWEPRVDIDGNTGEVTSTPQKDGGISDFSQILKEFDIDPEAFEVDGGARVSKWQTFHGEWLTSYKFRIRAKASVRDINDLIEIVRDVKPLSTTLLDVDNNGKYAFVFAAGDLQLGKSDGDGTEGIVKRYRESLQKAVDKVHELGDIVGPILISWVGDCIEGMVSQHGKNARRTELTTTQQVKLLRRLMTETIKAFAPLTNDLRVVSVPGNHDEAQREPVTTDYSDSWAVDALVAVSEALEFNPEAFGHVKCEVVPYDELTSTIEVAGTTITHAHGHQWPRGKHFQWWSGQHWGGHSPGEADVLLCGHYHTGAYEQENFKHMIRTPSFEQESTYFRHRTGKIGNPSAVSFLTRNGKIKYMDYE